MQTLTAVNKDGIVKHGHKNMTNREIIRYLADNIHVLQDFRVDRSDGTIIASKAIW
jgi:hypothetical protein